MKIAYLDRQFVLKHKRPLSKKPDVYGFCLGRSESFYWFTPSILAVPKDVSITDTQNEVLEWHKEGKSKMLIHGLNIEEIQLEANP